MTRLYEFVRTVHRLFVLVAATLAIAMSLTGMSMKYSTTALRLFPNLNLAQLRYVHNQLTPYTGIVLIVMALSGLCMYILPPLIRRRASKRLMPQ